MRDTTLDVDSVFRLDEELRQVIARVAAAHGLADDWVNDHAAGFRPQTFEELDCSVLLDHPRLLVLGAPFDQVFVMKLYRVSAQDYEDMVLMWPHCTFASPAQAATRFYEAYPHAPEDPGLVHLIADIARISASGAL